jgi:hypothetical protein
MGLPAVPRITVVRRLPYAQRLEGTRLLRRYWDYSKRRAALIMLSRQSMIESTGLLGHLVRADEHYQRHG